MSLGKVSGGKLKASVVILTKNEEKHVERAVMSAKDFDEILVIDSNSTDRTVELAEAAGARVVQFTWDGKYPKKKEWSLPQCTNDWVIYLDADEYFTEDIVTEIRQVIVRANASAIQVPLRYFWLGKELRHGHRVSKRIGMRRSCGYWPRPDDLHVKNMWEVEGHYQPQISTGTVELLTSPLGHDDRDGLFDYFQRHNRYSDWEAQMLYDGDNASRQARSRLGRIATRLPFKGLVFFVYSYMVKAGFLDGREGLHYALALSFYYWQIGIKVREIELQESRPATERPSETEGSRR
ncbi:glycosyltransferase family 2 protein [Paeniglutamicibacter psychrophenolicus]|uniref:glycosyltransferase family 2 protein n=1 Tax=Paeniglutamicibacter psychrophenolicus TaxID=257454 RepID=UPI0027834EE9|nr:glycosyltransferase family 2 protein [Paeniglutamicibacter psychrophenolicus]MDQ0094667.1 glycosyltransferase involved in cell wall biosynthesis [Paeniglutamicibacter psychrophenolicus]